MASSSGTLSSSGASKLCSASKLKTGDWVSCVVYYRRGEYATRYTNHRGQSLGISDGIVENECYAADQFNVEKTIGVKRLRELMLHESGDAIFTVCFTKKPVVGDVEKKVDTILGGGADTWKSLPRKRRRSEIDGLMHGDQRRMVCHMKTHEEELGRLQVIDMEADGPHKERQVDLRTVIWLILKNVKYTIN